MTRPTRIVWTVAAAVFTAVNAAGAVLAAVAREPIHAGGHVLLGLAGAYLTWRLLARRTASLGAGAPEEIADDRLASLERSVDAVAIEVERIGESQRYMTKVLSAEKKPPRDAAGPRKPARPDDRS